MIYLYMILSGLIGAGAMAAVGFYEGYKICHETEETRAIAAENSRLQKEQADLKTSLDASQQEVTAANATDAKNQVIINDLRAQIQIAVNASAGSCLLDDAWLRRLDTVQ